MGMLHNAKYAVLVERAITAYWVRQGWAPDPARSVFPDVFFAVRETKMLHHVPIMTPGEVVVHFGFARMGRTSGTYGFRVLSADRATVHAEGHRVNVNLDPSTLRPMPFSEEIRAAAKDLMLAPVPA
ncbi:acyl-CoA thioesterase [Spiractinospora alimapuensis]|nr:acyl-CoA thioesterase [Spiractinospora alimapuensis]